MYKSGSAKIKIKYIFREILKFIQQINIKLLKHIMFLEIKLLSPHFPNKPLIIILHVFFQGFYNFVIIHSKVLVDIMKFSFRSGPFVE